MAPIEAPAELRRALEVLDGGGSRPSAEARQHALDHARTAALLLCRSPKSKILGACNRAECYEGVTGQQQRTLAAGV